MIRVKVPATTANLGPGFDCLGMALNLYNIIEVEINDDADNILIETSSEDVKIEKGEDNLIYKSIKYLFDYTGARVPPLKISQKINIPISRGLGSSAACIVGGLVAANEILKRPFDSMELLNLASQLEGHPDNVAPALLGGLVVSVQEGDEVKYVRHPIDKGIKLMALIPDVTLSTREARAVLPSAVSYKDAVFNVGRASLLTASLITGNLDNIRYAVGDRLHQPYRLKLIPHGETIRNEIYNNGGDAFFISGSGSTLMAVVSREETVKRMSEFVMGLDGKWDVRLLHADNNGVQILEN